MRGTEMLGVMFGGTARALPGSAGGGAIIERVMAAGARIAGTRVGTGLERALGWRKMLPPPLPVIETNTTGPREAGGGRTATLNVEVAMLSLLSCALQATVVVPTGNRLPD